MQLVPSITVLNGRTARLKRGDYKNEKVYDVSPLDVATQFEEHGIRRIHLVDLDGAKKGAIANSATLELISGYTNNCAGSRCSAGSPPPGSDNNARRIAVR